MWFAKICSHVGFYFVDRWGLFLFLKPTNRLFESVKMGRTLSSPFYLHFSHSLTLLVYVGRKQQMQTENRRSHKQKLCIYPYFGENMKQHLEHAEHMGRHEKWIKRQIEKFLFTFLYCETGSVFDSMSLSSLYGISIWYSKHKSHTVHTVYELTDRLFLHPH